MNIHIRRFIALTFILAFVIIAPILIFYTAGYRYNPKKQQLATAGTLVIQTSPRAAVVSLNGQNAYNTPIRLTDLSPQKYLINVTKDGYYPWKKTLSVNAQETTFAEDIILFKQSSPRKISNLLIDSMLVTPDHKGTALLSQSAGGVEIFYYNFGNENIEKIYSTTNTMNKLNLSWSKDGNFLLVSANAPGINSIIINRTAPSVTISVDDFIDQAKNIKFSLENDNVLFATSENKIVEATIQNKILLTNTVAEIDAAIETDFIVYNGYLYSMSKIKDNETEIFRNNLNEEADRPEPRIILPNGQYKIANVVDNHLVIEETENNKTIFVQLELNSILTSISSLSAYDYFEKQNILLTADRNEIITYDLNKYNSETTITRVSDGIDHACWYPESNYIVFTLNQQAKIIELDERDSRNQWELPIDHILDMTLDKKGENIYFIQDGTPGLFVLEIH
ncbi:hypothetical protein COT97_02555 [Candidatus Falkowbacteria bacterium CG10_big_fil_rev_8_21_14_0_10_39_11]|uniref:PEGA domain-containing protein n=1 Tax=Candidatus Falkowbacteria bacterium CG10_big_fil_rev_8_21_14_0_10_39_11 TaxID=1974565 RepID=A0A2H0V795_9BACT|nr:MAG: hypothetical protein COT97_02555 [Candidatus Falkowbacteria bacterium CG10_big_fil_rev_8_21_14_0_10_39_11]